MSALLESLLLPLLAFAGSALLASWFCHRSGMSHLKLWSRSLASPAASSSAFPSEPETTSRPIILCMDRLDRRRCPDRRSVPERRIVEEGA